jgi:hypothetical protein
MNENILEMLGGEKQTPSPNVEKEEGIGNKIDSDVLGSMLTADGVDGNFRTEKEPEEEELKDSEKIKVSDGKVKEQLGKYSKEFIKDVMKRPDQYTVETSRGVMTIRDAINAGWDPKTGEFLEENRDKSEEYLSELDEADQGAVKSLMDPANAGIAAAEAEEMGLDPNSPLVKRPPQALDASALPPEQQMTPEMMAMAGGGAVPPQQAGAPPAEGIDPEQLKMFLRGMAG